MKKVLALVLITVLLIVAVSGCGLLQKAKDVKDGLDDIGDFVDDIEDDFTDDTDNPGDDSSDDGDDSSDDGDDTDETVLSGNIYYPADVFDLFEKYQEFGYVFTSVDEEGSSSEFSVYYISEGTEDVDGIEAEVFSATYTEGDTNEYKFWFDGEWECIKATVNGEENNDWGAAALTMPLSIYVNWVALTEMVIDADGVLDTFSYKLEEERTESSDLGDMNVYELTNVFSPVIVTYGITEIDGDQVYVMIKNSTDDTSRSEELLVTHAVPR